MLKTYCFDINDYGLVKSFQGEKGRIKNVYLWAESDKALRITLIADRYREIITDALTAKGLVKLPVSYQAKKRQMKLVVKSVEPVKAKLNITIEYD